MKKTLPILIVDIDDTAADTVNHFVRLLNKKYSNPYGLSDIELIEKYRIIPTMHFWQTPEIRSWLDAQAEDNEAQYAIPPATGAVEALKILSTYFRIVYISSRPDTVLSGTSRWLKDNGFPDGALILRGHFDDTNGNAWKAKIIQEKFPETVGIIDDNPEIIPKLSRQYKGVMYLYGTRDLPENKEILIRKCSTWDEALHFILKDNHYSDPLLP